MYQVGDKIVYGENGVCTIVCIAPLNVSGASRDRLYYHLSPLIGSGTYFAPVDTTAFICKDSRFNHVDAFYKDLFRTHSCDALVSIVKGLRQRMGERKTRSSRAESTMKRAKDMLNGELSVALDLDLRDVDDYVRSRIGEGS